MSSKLQVKVDQLGILKRLSSPEQSFRMKKLLRSVEGNILYQDSADLRLELEELLEKYLKNL